jgi:hypothetical protein
MVHTVICAVWRISRACTSAGLVVPQYYSTFCQCEPSKKTIKTRGGKLGDSPGRPLNGNQALSALMATSLLYRDFCWRRCQILGWIGEDNRAKEHSRMTRLQPGQRTVRVPILHIVVPALDNSPYRVTQARKARLAALHEDVLCEPLFILPCSCRKVNRKNLAIIPQS